MADHAELTTSLAERLMAAEAELARLRAEVEPDVGGGAADRTDPG